jgi:hypothetical protein
MPDYSTAPSAAIQLSAGVMFSEVTNGCPLEDLDAADAACAKEGFTAGGYQEEGWWSGRQTRSRPTSSTASIDQYYLCMQTPSKSPLGKLGSGRITRYSEVITSRLLSQSCGRRENDRSMVKDRLALAFST